MLKQVDTKKHISEHKYFSVRVFLSILAHLAQSFYLILNGIDEKKSSDVIMQILESMSVSITGCLVE